MATKLWDKGFEPDKMIEEYTVGNDRELDMRLARYDVQGSLAHIAMLETIGLLTAGELEKLTAGLKEIAAEIEAGRFEIEPGTEDVHSQVELMLTRRLGDAGKKIHSGRSRNDQVLVDLKLFLRDELRQTAEAVKTVFDRLQTLSEQYKEILMPGIHPPSDRHAFVVRPVVRRLCRNAGGRHAAHRRGMAHRQPEPPRLGRRVRLVVPARP